MRDLLLLLIPLLLSQFGYPVLMASASTGTELVTLIVKVNPSEFKPAKIKELGGQIVYSVNIVPVVIVKAPKYMVDKLKEVPGVVHISLDIMVHILGKPASPPGREKSQEQPPQETPWGIERIRAPDVWNLTDGYTDLDEDGDSEVEIAVIDTGVDYDHPDLQANIKWLIAVLNGRITTNPRRADDGNGHGTHVIGIIAAINNDIGVVGAAPRVEVYSIKALNDAGIGWISDITIAIDLAIKGPDGLIDSDGDGLVVGDPDDDAAEVISMSFGGDSDVPELHEVIQKAYGCGVVLVAAAGNEGDLQPSYPARYPEVIAVGATNSSDGVPEWSNRNPELAAPGVDIKSTYPDDTYAVLSGTSMACPHVSGAVALIQAVRLANGLALLPPGGEYDYDEATVRGILHRTADDLGDYGYDVLYGYGVVRADKAVQEALEV
ncbi:MAG: peptidase S8 [Thermoprotei archaeon]|nr:MAG: peptidase S8 [Thermoprotei archaeon]